MLPFAAGSFDLIVANLSLHWVNDLPGALVQIRRALRPDGLFLASLPGLGTLQELREALAGCREHAARWAVAAGFALPGVAGPGGAAAAGRLCPAGRGCRGAADPLPDPLALLQDLRAAGEANAVLARDGRVPPRALLPMALAALPGMRMASRPPCGFWS